jgi:signal transduction histidine kinase
MTEAEAATPNEFSFGSFRLRRDQRLLLKDGKPVRPGGRAHEILAALAIEWARSDAALKRCEAFLAEAERLGSTGAFSWRAATDELACSDQLCSIFGFDKKIRVTLDLLGSRLHPEDLPSLRETIERARHGGEEISYGHRLLMPDNSVKYLPMVAHPVRAQDGSLEYIGAVQDVSQQHLFENALNRARSELTHVARVLSLDALAASIVHEVNQPLTAVIANASTCLRMLSADLPDVECAREAARRTLRDGQRAAQVIDRLRSLFAKRATKTESVDLNDAAREVIALCLSELQRNRIAVSMELAHDLPPVEGDRVQLQQVILNLLLNASDAMAGVEPSSKELVVGSECHEGDRVTLSVRDAGTGLDAQILDRLFQPLCTTKSEGMGIGLFVSRSIIENHHGSIDAKRNNGPGATFSFSLPRLRQKAERSVGRRADCSGVSSETDSGTVSRVNGEGHGGKSWATARTLHGATFHPTLPVSALA